VVDSGRAARFELEPFSYGEALRLQRELGLAEPVAVTLVRRGYRTPEQARRFLEATDSHEPWEFADMERAVARVRAALAAGERITVHGDYDADGVAATAILVWALRELGADCDWLIPDRVADGYGLREGAVRRLAERGTRLLITVDCGITCASEVMLARELGVDVIVTDHHRPPERLPDCPLLHPVVSGYPCPDLCGAGVAYKLAEALLGSERAAAALDLVALATVADMVPLRGENRSLVRRGIAEARRAPRPGMRALMAVAGVVPEALDEGDLAFRLAPRINASGRLYRADAGVELMLTTDAARAERIAEELDRANRERRAAEEEVLAAAERELASAPGGAEAPALVLWGEGWHPGVVGICASRLVERYHRPAVLIALDGSGRGRGSGRSVADMDLLAVLRECEEHLLSYGGHRAAAGLELAEERLEAFRAAFVQAADRALAGVELSPRERVDAVVGGESLGHEVADQIARLGPFGAGNPEVRLLVPRARLEDVRPMGEGERHARFSLASGAARAAGVAFGVNGSLAAAAERPVDVSLRLELNRWNGAVSPRVVLGRLYVEDGSAAEGAGDAEPRPDELVRRFDAEWTREPGAPALPEPEGRRRELIDRSGGSGVAAVAALASTGESVLLLSADALWRRELVERAARPTRFGGGAPVLLASRRSLDAGVAAAERAAREGGMALADWQALALAPGLAARFQHVIIVDPAPTESLRRLALEAAEDGGGFVHVLGEAADPTLSRRSLALAWPDRDELAAAWRRLASAGDEGPLDLGVCLHALAVSQAPRAAEHAARCLRVFAEIGLVQLDEPGGDRRVQVLSSGGKKLEQSPSYIAYCRAREEGERFLTRGGKPS